MIHKPLHDRVIIRRIDVEVKSKGGIYLGEIEKERETTYGKVIARGDGKVIVGEDGKATHLPMTVNVGDIVICNARIPTKMNVNGEELFYLRESDIVERLLPEFEGEFAEKEFKAEGYEFSASNTKILN